MKFLGNARIRALASTALLLGAGTALAQTPAPTTAEATDTGEIVVTAQRRAENLQDVPIAITAVSSEMVENLNLKTIDSIQSVTPNMTFNTGYGFSQLFIRGVGSNFTTAGLENAVATYVDGAYLERASGITFDLVDVASVQVLKGPQGTLYGRNATGGAVLITTANPTDQFEGRVAAEYGRFDHAQGDVMINAPLSDTLAVRVAGRYTTDGNYVHNIPTDSGIGKRRSWVLRGKLKFEPSSDFNAVLTAEHSDEHGAVLPERQRLAFPLCAGCGTPGNTAPNLGRYETDLDYVQRPEVKATNINLRMVLTSGDISLESVTAYRDQKEVARSDQDYSIADIFAYQAPTGGKTFTQDLTITTDMGGWYDVTMGLSYLHDKGYYFLFADGAGFRSIVPGDIPRSFNRIRTESVSGFAEVRLRPIEHLTITAGGRYTYDDRLLKGNTNVAGNIAFAGANGILSLERGSNFSSFVPRFVVAYDADAVNVYASYSEGFKAGGFTSPAFTALPAVKPEALKNYEAGIKYVSPDRKLRANLAAFYYRYSDIQVTIVDIENTGGGFVSNAGSARGKGIEFDFQYQANDWLQIFGGGGYLHARYKEFKNATQGYTPGGVRDLDGFPLNRAPDWNGFIGANVSVPVGSDWKADLSGVARYSGSFDHVPGAGGVLGLDHEPSYTLVNVTGGVGPADESYKIGFYLDNAFNERYALSRQTSDPFGAYEAPARPRTYGVRAQAKF
jgi:iron complex outermembrane receptor protein